MRGWTVLSGFQVWLLRAYFDGLSEGRRRSVLFGVGGFLAGLGIGLMAGGEA